MAEQTFSLPYLNVVILRCIIFNSLVASNKYVIVESVVLTSFVVTNCHF